MMLRWKATLRPKAAQRPHRLRPALRSKVMLRWKATLRPKAAQRPRRLRPALRSRAPVRSRTAAASRESEQRARVVAHEAVEYGRGDAACDEPWLSVSRMCARPEPPQLRLPV